MTKKVGITGGIGTGKSFVSKIFRTLGIAFYDADQAAKSIMSTNKELKSALINSFGKQTYFEDGSLNRAWLSSQVFNNDEQLKLLNSIVHPIVIKAGIDWANKQTGHYSLKEAALLFESNSYKELDSIIVVTAPLEVRIDRVIKRDGIIREDVLRRIDKQMSEEEKIKMADFVIVNDGTTPLLPQIFNIHKTIIEK